ncbi:MAG: TonB-dependent receptor plug domain-containing protein, partial [Gemmatimonadaceae bacterium]|nr:TonB-dependent receptor plug domain-containing protein [Gemmatimonadaceae bacterium]
MIRPGFLLFPFFVTLAGAQDRPATLDTVRVSITRDSALSPLLVPFAVSVVRPDSTRPGQRHSALDESLFLLPGVFVANRQNPTQDPRISIRGFGARSAFGVRGVRILWDGIPLTLADGQTPVDYVDLDAIDRIEIIRGSAAALYGNSSGGVVNLGTALPADSSFGVRVRQSREEGAMRRMSAQVNGRSDVFAFRAGINHASGKGFRDYSRLRATRASARATGTVFGNDLSLHLSALSLPLAQNPGSVTQAQMRADPRTADPLSVRRKAGKTVEQRQVGIGVGRKIADLGVSILVYGGTRDLNNPLTFATVTLDRTSGGATFRAELPARLKNLRASFAAGIDLQYQNDSRHEFENCVDVPAPAISARCPVKGGEMGAIRRNQREIVTSTGPYAKAELDINRHTLLT